MDRLTDRYGQGFTAIGNELVAEIIKNTGPMGFALAWTMLRFLNSRRGDYIVFPGQKRLADESGISVRKVRILLKEFERLGYVVPDPVTAEDGKRIGTTYDLTGLAAPGKTAPAQDAAGPARGAAPPRQEVPPALARGAAYQDLNQIKKEREQEEDPPPNGGGPGGEAPEKFAMTPDGKIDFEKAMAKAQELWPAFALDHGEQRLKGWVWSIFKEWRLYWAGRLEEPKNTKKYRDAFKSAAGWDRCFAARLNAVRTNTRHITPEMWLRDQPAQAPTPRASSRPPDPSPEECARGAARLKQLLDERGRPGEHGGSMEVKP